MTDFIISVSNGYGREMSLAADSFACASVSVERAGKRRQKIKTVVLRVTCTRYCAWGIRVRAIGPEGGTVFQRTYRAVGAEADPRAGRRTKARPRWCSSCGSGAKTVLLSGRCQDCEDRDR